MEQSKGNTPFWDVGYANKAVSCMGGPSVEVYEMASALRKDARVVEIGCGEGRNSLFLAQLGHKIFASDISRAAVDKVTLIANELDLDVSVKQENAEEFVAPLEVDMFIAQTVLHFLDESVWKPLLLDVIKNTREGGVHCLTNFMDEDEYPVPQEIVDCGHKRKFKRGDLEDIYNAAGWEIVRADHYVKWDSHPGIPIHSHSCEKIVARKPSMNFDLPKIKVERMRTPDTVTSPDFLAMPLGVEKNVVTAQHGEPKATYGIKIEQRTMGGNNQAAVADHYHLEDLIYGTHGFQIVNGRLTGKYRYFTTPTRVDIV